MSFTNVHSVYIKSYKLNPLIYVSVKLMFLEHILFKSFDFVFYLFYDIILN